MQWLQSLTGWLQHTDEAVRYPAYALTAAMTRRRCGALAAARSREMQTLLLDRGIEGTAAGLRWKYEVVSQLAGNPCFSAALAGDGATAVSARFAAYAQQGVFWRDARPQTDVESR